MCYRIVSCALYFMSFPVRRDQSDTPDGIWAVGATWVTAKAKHATGCSCAPRPLPRARLAELDRSPRRVICALSGVRVCTATVKMAPFIGHEARADMRARRKKLRSLLTSAAFACRHD